MTENYLSGKKRSLKIGVSGHSENLTSLQTVGGVGIGTTNTDKRALYVVGNTEITGVLTASQFKGDGSGLTGVAATDHVSTFDLVVAGISTFHDDVRITGGGINAVGVITGTSFDGAISEWVLGADGSSHYTFTGPGLTGAENDPIIYLKRGQKYRFKNASGGHPFRIQSDPNGSSGTAYNDGITNNDAGDGTTLAWNVQFDTPNVLYYQCTSHGNMGGKIYIGNSGESATIGSGGLVISGVTTGINAAGVSSFIQLDVNTGGIDVDGPTELDELNVTGVSTFTSSLKVDGAVDIGTGGLDVDGQTDLDELVVAGVSTFTGNIVAATAEFSGNVTIGGTLTVEDKTNVDSIGLITARTGVRVTAGGIDVTAGVSTFNDTVKFDGAVDIGTGGVDIDGQLDVDELIVAGVSTFSKAIDLNAGIDVDGQADLDEVVVAGVATFSNDVFVGTAITIHAGNVHATGIISAIKFVGDGSQITNLPGINTLGTSNLSDVNVSGTTTTSQLRVSGIGTAEKFFVSTGGLDVDGQTDLDELVVAGVATFSAYPSIDADNEIQVGTAIQLGKAGVITASSYRGDGSQLSGVGTQGINIQARSLVVSGVSTFYDDVKIVGGGSTAGNQITIGATTLNDGTLTFDGSAGQLFSITNNLTDGSIFSVNDVSGMPSIDVGAAGTIQLAPHGAGELVGIGTTRPTSKLDVVGDVQVVGVVTATSFSGSGANLTGVGTQSLNVQAQSLTVAGMSTFFGGLFLPDSTTLRIGGAAAGGDLQLYHNGSNTYIDNSTGTLHIRHSSGTGQIQILDSSQGITIQGKTGEDSIKAVPDAQVELYYNDALKLATNTGGITVTGGGNFSGIVSATSFEGSGANLTGVGTQSLNVQAQSLTVAGVSTFNGAVSINAASGFPFTVQASNSTIPAIKINNQSGTQRGQILANDFLNIEAFGNDIIFDSNHSGGTAGDILLKSNSTTIVEVPGDGAGVVVTGIVTASLFSGAGILDEDDMASDSATKLATQQSIKAYVDANAGGGGGTGDFYVGFTSSVTMNAASYETTGHTFPSTASKTYTIDSIMASNIANVGVGTTVNLIASISSNSGVAAGTTEQTYFAYNVPIAAGGAVELIKEPFVANPNDIVKLWATDSTYSGISSAIQVHMTYTQQDSTDFFGKYAANTSIGSTTIIGIHTAGPTYAAALQSIHITNRSDAGAFPVDILLTDSTGIVTTYLVKNLVIPKYSAVEILERPKRMETGSSLGVKVQQTGTIDVIVSGKTYS